MTQKRSPAGIIIVILLGVLALALSWFDAPLISCLSLKWIPQIGYASSFLFRIIPLIVSLPILLCAVFTAIGKRTPALITGIIGCVLNTALAVSFIVTNINAWAGVISSLLIIVACVLSVVASNGKFKIIGFVLLGIAILSLALSVWGCFFITSHYSGDISSRNLFVYIFQRGNFRLLDSLYVLFSGTRTYFGLYYFPLSRFLLCLACAIGVLTSKTSASAAKAVHADTAPVNRDYVYSGPAMPGISAVSQGKAIVLSIITLGIYDLIWQYRLIRNTRVIAEENTGCFGEFMLYLFIPFYSWHWVYSRQKKIAAAAKQRGYAVQAHPALHFWLVFVGAGLIGKCLLQETFNRLARGQVPLIQQAAPTSQPVQSQESSAQTFEMSSTAVSQPAQSQEATPQSPVYMSSSDEGFC